MRPPAHERLGVSVAMSARRLPRSLGGVIAAAVLTTSGCGPSDARLSVRILAPGRDAQALTSLAVSLRGSGPGLVDEVANFDDTGQAGIDGLGLTAGSWRFTVQVLSTIHGNAPLLEAQRDVDIVAGENTVPFLAGDFQPLDGDGDMISDWEEYFAGCNPTVMGCGPAAPEFTPRNLSTIDTNDVIRVDFGRAMDTSVASVTSATGIVSNTTTGIIRTWRDGDTAVELTPVTAWSEGNHNLTIQARDALGEDADVGTVTYDILPPVTFSASPVDGSAVPTTQSIVLTFDVDMDTVAGFTAAGTLGAVADLSWSDPRSLAVAPQTTWPLGMHSLVIDARSGSGLTARAELTYDVTGGAAEIASITPTPGSVEIDEVTEVTVAFTVDMTMSAPTFSGDRGVPTPGHRWTDARTLVIEPPGGGWADSQGMPATLRADVLTASMATVVVDTSYIFDADPPQMTSAPAMGGRLNTTQSIEITFDEPVNTATLAASGPILGGGNTTLTYSMGDTRVTLTPPGSGWAEGPGMNLGLSGIEDDFGHTAMVDVIFEVVDPTGPPVFIVDTEGSDNNTGTVASPFQTLGRALMAAAAAPEPALIRMKFGLYQVAQTIAISDDVTIEGSWSSAFISRDPNPAGFSNTLIRTSVATVMRIDSGDVTLDGLNIQGTSSTIDGTGLQISGSGMVVVRNCYITGATASSGNTRAVWFSGYAGAAIIESSYLVGGGGPTNAQGIGINSSSAATITIQNNVVVGGDGADGIVVDMGRPLIRNNTIVGGSLAPTDDFAIDLANNAVNTRIENNILVSPSTCVQARDPSAYPETFSNNALVSCSSLYRQDMTNRMNLTDTINLSTAATPTLAALGNVQGPMDPSTLFVNPTGPDALLNAGFDGDFDLIDCVTNAPICDGGDPSLDPAIDFDGITRHATTPSIGAFEGN